jgi:O-antigen ligase
MTTERPRRWVVPIYLVVCLLLGGSSQGIWSNMALQLAATAIIAWALVTRGTDELTSASRQLLILAGIAGLVVALQLVLLPVAAWTALPGRELVAQGFQSLGYPLPAQPVSLTPYDTVAAALAALPAVAVLVATVRIRQRETWIAAALLGAMFTGVLLGALQVATGGVDRSPWYFYDYSNNGAVGFFANSNHMGSLLLVSIPFAAALLASFASRSRSPRSGTLMLGVAAFLVVVGGIALNRSLAAVGLAVPVLLFSLMLLPVASNVRRIALLGGALALVACVLFLTSSPISGDITGSDLRSVRSRADIWQGTLELVRQTFPAGTGLGSFETVFPLTEEPAEVRSNYANHAHNDYLQVLLEMGLAGALLVFAFLAWWIIQVVRTWRSSLSTHYARAATIASGALLAHSIVDYPLRTVALSAIFAMCLGLMAQPRREQRSSDASQSRPTKHLSIG